MKLKARICPHGNRDRLKDEGRKDAGTAEYDMIRVLASMEKDMDSIIAYADIKGAYLQLNPYGERYT